MTDVKVIRPSCPMLSAGAGVQAPGPASVAQSSDSKAVDSKALSTDAVSSSSSPSLRDELIKELLGGAPSEVNRYYTGTVNAWTDVSNVTYAGSVVTLNAIPQGVGAGQRLGDSVRCKRVRIRIHLRPGEVPDYAPASGVTAGDPVDVEFSYATRVIVGVDKMPVIGTPVYVDTLTWDIGSNFPSSTAATHTNPLADFSGTPAPFAGQTVLAVRNPQTLSRYHIMYDRIHNFASRYPSNTPILSGGSNTFSMYMRTASEFLDLDFDLHGMVTQWFAQGTDTALFTNRLFFMIVADAPSGGPVRYKYMTELEFVNVP